MEQDRRDGRNALEEVKLHRLAIFSVDNLDMMNRHGLLVDSKLEYRLHFTAIQEGFRFRGIYTRFGHPIPVMRSTAHAARNLKLRDAKSSVEAHVSN